MSAGGTILVAGIGGAAGVIAANAVGDAFYVRTDRMYVSAIGAAAGAVLATFIKVTVAAADNSSGALSGPPPQFLGFP